MIVPANALQQQPPFARHFIDSSAAKADRDIGSGDGSCIVPERFEWQPAWPNYMDGIAPGHFFLPVGTIRYGEATHPGPEWGNMLTVGVSNPCGLRQKEDQLLQLGPGIWSLAETQLSQQTFRTSSGILHRRARELNREIRFFGGAPAPLRFGSTWAGKWTGVAVLSDVAATVLDVPWPHEHWSSGRLLLTRHWASSMPITVGTFYGYPKGPTWPGAKQLSDELLTNFTTQVVLGMGVV